MDVGYLMVLESFDPLMEIQLLWITPIAVGCMVEIYRRSYYGYASETNKHFTGGHYLADLAT